MNRTIAILCVMSLLAASGRGAPVVPAAIQAKPPTRESIDRLLTLSGVEQNRVELTTELNRFFAANLQRALRGQSLTPAQQEALRELRRNVPATIESDLSWRVLRGRYEKVYAETFTQSEVDGLIAFYSSPAGQAFLRKQSLLVLNSIQLAERGIAETPGKTVPDTPSGQR